MTENQNGLGLLEKFGRAQQEVFKQIDSITSLDYSYQNLDPCSPRFSSNIHGKKEEIYDKLNYYRDWVEQKDDELFQFEQNKHEFFEFFENQFNEIYKVKDLSESHSCIAELENLLFSDEKIKEKFIEKKMTLRDKKNFMDKIKTLMKFLERDLKFDRQKENRAIEKLQNFSKKIREMTKNLDDTTESKKENLNYENLPTERKFSGHGHGPGTTEKNVKFQTNKKKKRTNRRREQLLSTAYLKKSKSAYGEDDYLFSPEPEEQIKETNNINITNNLNSNLQPLQVENQIKITKTKLLLRNFLQIYLVKQNEIFSKYFYSKYDHSVLYEYRKFKFYEIKFCISLSEDFSDISNHIEFLKSLFNKYLMIYNKTECSNFLKISICGVGKRQSVIQKSITKLINTQVKKDCLIKISMFSNIFNCMEGNVKKIRNPVVKDNYVFHSNMCEQMFKKILNKIN
jgi:hypothetical protein